MTINNGSFLSRVREGETVFGVWLTSGSVSLADSISRTPGVDYICIDMQHGLAHSEETIFAIATSRYAESIGVLVRVGANNELEIGRSLDLGAVGVIVPGIESAEEANRAAAACRYPPNGHRSYGPSGAVSVFGSDDPRDLEQALCFVMIETKTGVDHLEEICRTKSIDGVYIGPWDLAINLGRIPGELGDDALLSVAERVRSICNEEGKIPGIQCSSGVWAARYAEMGFRLITVGTDGGLLSQIMAKEFSTARGLHDSNLQDSIKGTNV
ncbi:MAG: aldolase/citrate lyase family protein [Actinobacteria bacterium]|nr:aldolase/citrate lyase family protein [Actinomycetota bacterium]